MFNLTNEEGALCEKKARHIYTDFHSRRGVFMHVIERLMSLARTQNAENFIESMIACFAAPVICGVKCGKLLNLSRSGENLNLAWASIKGELLGRFSLEAVEVPSRGTGVLLFLYDRNLLACALASDKAQGMLGDLGYPVENGAIDDQVSFLIEKFKTGLPHEVGLFLGYPPEDVRAFIHNEGRGAKLTGYWKVYGDEDEARKIFSNYRRAEIAGAVARLEKTKFALSGANGLHAGLPAA